MKTVINNANILNNLDDLKNEQLKILKSFLTVCDSLNLHYFLTGGTALGAVRHKGFIPWDDDIDVCMPREDYELFLKKGQLLLPSHLFIQTYLTDSDYRLPFAKIRNSNTTYIEVSSQNLKINHGIFIDVFPIDGLPKNHLLIKKNLFLKKATLLFVTKDYIKRSLLKRILAYLSWFFVLASTPKKALIKFDNKCKKYNYNNSEKTILYGGAWDKKEIHSRSTYGSGTIMSFEGIKVIVPEKFDIFLTEMYGDYMKLPPIEKRVGHHGCLAFSSTESYTKRSIK